MSSLPFRRIMFAGLLGGAVLNLIDTPWSVLVMVPRMAAFQAAHGLSASAWAGPWFLATHWATMGVIAAAYAVARRSLPAGPGLAMGIAAAMLLVNRGFGFGTVLTGLMPAGIFAGFSLGFAPALLLGSLVAGRVLDRG